MKDSTGIILSPGCKLRSTLGNKNSTEIIYKGGDAFECPGGGHIYHNQESLLNSYWVVVELPKVVR